MPLTFNEQLEILANSTTREGVHGLARALRDPELVTPEESRSIAESLGVANPFLKWAINTAADPTVWIAAVLAKRTPAWRWVTGGVPKRLSGAATEFSGLSRFLPVARVFRGTGVDSMISLGLHRMSQVHQTLRPVQEALAGLDPLEKRALVRFREEGLAGGLTEKAKAASDLMTEAFRSVWTKLAEVSDVRGGIRGAGQHATMTWGPYREAIGERLVERPRMPRDFATLFPHLSILSDDGMLVLSGSEALTRQVRAGGKALRQALEADGLGLKEVTRKLEDGTSERVVVQLGPWKVNAADQIETSMAQWHQMMRGNTGKVFFSHLEPRRRDIPMFSPQGEGAFVLDVDQVFAHYVRGAARTYAWNAPLSPVERKIGSYMVENPAPVQRAGRFFTDAYLPKELSEEPLMVQIMRAGLESMNVPVEKFVVAGTEHWHQPVRGMRFRAGDQPLKLQALEHLVQSLKGSHDERQVLVNVAWSKIAERAEGFLQKTSPELAGKLATHFEVLKAKGTDKAIDNFLASYQYYATLGLNVGSAVGNAMQTPLTTLPSLGLGPTLGGVADFVGRLPRYARELAANFRTDRSVRNLPSHARSAWERTFPELAEHKIDVDPRLFEIHDPDLTAAPGRLGEVFRNSEKYLGWMLAPFRAVETANRSIAFFSARRAGMDAFRLSPQIMPKGLLGPQGEMTDAAMEFLNLHSARAVNATQFLPGGGTRSVAQDFLPVWLRPLTSFPTRIMSWAGESTVRGALTEKERELAGGLETMLGGGRNWGVLARAYLAGEVARKGFRDVLGLDVARWVGFGPFDPSDDLTVFPTPPMAGVAINIGKAIAGREWDRTQPAQLPGVGQIPIPKQLVPGGVALTRLARAIDMFEPDLGGFVDEDRRLMRRAGEVDLVMGMLGIPTEKARRERIQLTELRTRIGRMREYKRKFSLSLLGGDLNEAARLRGEYAETFPQMPALDVEAEDLHTYAINARIPRLARALKSLGDQRPILEAQYYEIDPEMIAPLGAVEPELELLRD